MRLSDAALDDLRDRNSVADVVGRLGGTLRRAGRTLMGPCPICGGSDKGAQRFEVKNDTTWVCAVCPDGGDVIRLVEKTLGLDFRAAVDWLGGVADLDPAEVARRAQERAARTAAREAEEARAREVERERLFAMWRAAQPVGGDDPASVYLRWRGLEPAGLRLRCATAVPYWHGTDATGRHRAIHTGPAMLAAILRPDGRFTGLHITWLAADGRGKVVLADPETGAALPAKKMRGAVRAGRIELLPCRDPVAVVLGEGIETVATVADAKGRPEGVAYWTALDLGNLGGPAIATVAHPTACSDGGRPKFVPGPEPDLSQPAIPVPATVAALTLLGDGDSDAFLTRTALIRATRRYARPGRVIRHAWAPAGQDFNDVLLAE